MVGYFLEERSSQELARFLGVTESRVSQMRTEALEMLRAGIAAQYEANAAEASQGRQEKRRERYASAIGNAGTWQDRISVNGSAGSEGLLAELLAVG